MTQTARALRSSPADSFADVATVFADSAAAVAEARRLGAGARAIVATTAPALVLQPNVSIFDLGDAMDGARLAQLGDALDHAARTLDRTVAAAFGDRDAGLLAAHGLIAKQNMIAKLAAVELARLPGPFGIVRLASGDAKIDGRLNPDWAQILGPRDDVATATLAIDVEDEDVARGGHRVAGFFTRFMFESASSILYRAIASFYARVPFGGVRGDIYVWRENPLLKEAAFALASRGYGIKSLRVPRADPQPLEAHECADLGAAVTTAADSVAAAIGLQAQAAARIATSVQARIQADIVRARAVAAVADRLFARLPARLRPKAIVTNARMMADSIGVHAACRKHAIPLIGCQHAITVELHQGHDAVAIQWDNVACDALLAYCRRGADILSRNPYASGRPIVVGAPAELRRPARWRGKSAGLPPVYYVSTALPTGNVQLAAMKGVPDGDKARREVALVERVLAKLPHGVLYKPYPAVRYADPDPPVVAARTAPNIKVYGDHIDLRYLMGDARVIVTARATSTFAWCVMSGKPVVYIDHPYDVPLRPAARALIERGIFVFDGAAPDFHARLLTFLTQPLAAIETAYAARSADRRILIAELIDSYGGGTGRRAAAAIQAAIAERTSREATP